MYALVSNHLHHGEQLSLIHISNEMVPQETKHGVSAAFSKDTGLSSFINDVEQHYSGADVVTFSFDHQKARMDKGCLLYTSRCV